MRSKGNGHETFNSTETASLRARLLIFFSFASLINALNARSAFSAADMPTAGQDLIKTRGHLPFRQVVRDAGLSSRRST